MITRRAFLKASGAGILGAAACIPEPRPPIVSDPVEKEYPADGREAVDFFTRWRDQIDGYEARHGCPPDALLIDRSQHDPFFRESGYELRPDSGAYLCMFMSIPIYWYSDSHEMGKVFWPLWNDNWRILCIV
jgi:hypothetical protein